MEVVLNELGIHHLSAYRMLELKIHNETRYSLKYFQFENYYSRMFLKNLLEYCSEKKDDLYFTYLGYRKVKSFDLKNHSQSIYNGQDNIDDSCLFVVRNVNDLNLEFLEFSDKFWGSFESPSILVNFESPLDQIKIWGEEELLKLDSKSIISRGIADLSIFKGIEDDVIWFDIKNMPDQIIIESLMLKEF